MTDDYADRWAARERTVARMNPAAKRGYAIGLSHAYADVFEALCAAMDQGQDLHDLSERISAQWDDVHATQVAR